jgi:hypothetical protein
MAARLLPLNPEIAVDNRRRYCERATHRISQMTLQRPRAHPRSKNGAPLGYGVLKSFAPSSDMVVAHHRDKPQ